MDLMGTLGIFDILMYYILFAGIFLIINGIVAGYNKRDITNNDMIDAILWPISVSILFGLITRLLTEKYADYKITKSKTKGKK